MTRPVTLLHEVIGGLVFFDHKHIPVGQYLPRRVGPEGMKLLAELRSDDLKNLNPELIFGPPQKRRQKLALSGC